jgi:hypothetical protein
MPTKATYKKRFNNAISRANKHLNEFDDEFSKPYSPCGDVVAENLRLAREARTAAAMNLRELPALKSNTLALSKVNVRINNAEFQRRELCVCRPYSKSVRFPKRASRVRAPVFDD